MSQVVLLVLVQLLLGQGLATEAGDKVQVLILALDLVVLDADVVKLNHPLLLLLISGPLKKYKLIRIFNNFRSVTMFQPK